MLNVRHESVEQTYTVVRLLEIFNGWGYGCWRSWPVKKRAADLGAWLCFEDEEGQGLGSVKIFAPVLASGSCGVRKRIRPGGVCFGSRQRKTPSTWWNC